MRKEKQTTFIVFFALGLALLLSLLQASLGDGYRRLRAETSYAPLYQPIAAPALQRTPRTEVRNLRERRARRPLPSTKQSGR